MSEPILYDNEFVTKTLARHKTANVYHVMATALPGAVFYVDFQHEYLYLRTKEGAHVVKLEPMLTLPREKLQLVPINPLLRDRARNALALQQQVLNTHKAALEAVLQ